MRGLLGSSSDLSVGGDPHPYRQDRIQNRRDRISNVTGPCPMRRGLYKEPTHCSDIQTDGIVPKTDGTESKATGIVSKTTGMESKFPIFSGGPSAGSRVSSIRGGFCPESWTEGGNALRFPSLPKKGGRQSIQDREQR